MGAKIITEKDFWICKGGLMPAPIQSTQLKALKKDDTKYITINDKSTASFIDFACKKMMWLMALIVAVIAVLVVATGGAALIAIGAIAGAAGAAFGAVVGSLLCGQKAAMARNWIGQKSNFSILGIPTVTGDHKMICSIFGEEITYAPNIKNWWQAASLGVANFLGGVLEGAMIGAAVGGGAALIQGGIAALAEGGIASLGRSAFQLARGLPGNLARNYAASWTSGLGAGLRSIMGAQHTMQTYVETGEAGVGDFAAGVFGMETGTRDAVHRIATGQGTAMDYVGLALWFVPLPKTKPGEAKPGSAEEGRTNQAPEESRPGEPVKNEGTEVPGEKAGKDGEAFEDPALLSNNKLGALGEQAVVDRVIAQGYTEVLQIQNNSGHGVDIIARNPLTGDVKAIEVKANSSKLSPDQQLGGETYVQDRLNRAVNGERGYGIPPNPPELKTNAETAQRWLDEAPNVDYEVHRVPVDRSNGTVGGSKVSPWDPE